MLEDIENLQAELQDGMYEAVFFNESVASSIASATKEQKANSFSQNLSWQYRLSFSIDTFEDYDSVYYVSSDLLSEAGETVFSEGKTSVSAGEIVLSAQTFYSYLARCYDTSNEFASNLDNELNGQGDIYSWLKGENIPSSGDANYEAYRQYLEKPAKAGNITIRWRCIKSSAICSRTLLRSILSATSPIPLRNGCKSRFYRCRTIRIK